MSSSRTPKVINRNVNIAGVLTRSQNQNSKTPKPKTPVLQTTLAEKVAQLQSSHTNLKNQLEVTLKTSEEERLGMVEEIKSLELIIKLQDEDHKKEILNLKNQCSLMSEEIKKLKSKFDNTKCMIEPPSKCKKIESNLNDGKCSENGRNKTYSEVLKTATKNIAEGNKDRKGRVLLLTSSHGRDCSDLLDKRLKNKFDVQCFFKPSASINAVVESAREQTKDFDENDYLIVLGGSNNINEPNLNHLPQVTEKIKEIVPLSKKTNLIISTIPNRFDRPELNEAINSTNKSIHNTINSLKNKNSKQLGICFLNERLKRHNFTNHGLHLNRSGKVIFCNRLAELIESRLQSSGLKTVKKTNNDFLVNWLKTGKGK